MKKIINFLLLLCMISMITAACGQNERRPQSVSDQTSESVRNAAFTEQTRGTTEKQTDTALIYADFSFGAADGEEKGRIQTYELEYEGELTPEILADGLSELTDLDFFIQSSRKNDEIVVAWDKDSTLLSGLDDREQKEEFFFFDADSLCWFMMDSLWRTFIENFEVENIYYTTEDGEDLVIDDLLFGGEFQADFPFMGSVFYQAHYDVKGDDPD